MLLRESYRLDPYPSQARVEELASHIGVGTKTIVNWFHNHRMRAKQSFITGTDGSSGTSGVKAERDDETSNDTSGNDGYAEGEGRQWVFPDKEEQCDGWEKADGDTSSPGVAGAPGTTGPDLESPIGNAPIRSLSSGANEGQRSRRKNSRPKWVYEGVHLERSHSRNSANEANDSAFLENADTDSNPCNTLMANTENGTANLDERETKENSGLESNRLESADENIPTSSGGQVKAPEHRVIMERMQKAVERSDMEWEEVDREQRINTMEKHLEKSEEEQWEEF